MTDGKQRTNLAVIVALAAGLAALLPLSATARPMVYRVGAVTRHAGRFLGRHVHLSGYLLARERGYVLFSDEPHGRISRYDLPVTGVGIGSMRRGIRYMIEGAFLDHGLVAANGNPDHLRLSAPPRSAHR